MVAAGSVNSVLPTAEKRFYPGMVDGIETEDYAFYLGEKCLYDSATIGVTVAGYPGSGLSLPGAVTPVYTIGARWIPLLDPVLVRLRLPDRSGIDTTSLSTDRSFNQPGRPGLLRRKRERRTTARMEGSVGLRPLRRIWQLSARIDSIPPEITPIGPLEGADLSRATRIAFRIADNLGALRRFRAELDGRWLCFTNDKALAYIYKFDRHCPRGAHTLKVTVEDVAGNRAEAEYHFKR